MRRQIENAVEIMQRPYTAEMIAAMIEAPVAAVQAELDRLEAAGRVKAVDGVYLTCRPAALSVNKRRFDQALARQMLQVIREKRIASVRALADEVGYSRQYAYLYMEALASLGVLKWDAEKSRYVAKKTVRNSTLHTLGVGVKKGILGKMKYGRNERERNQKA